MRMGYLSLQYPLYRRYQALPGLCFELRNHRRAKFCPAGCLDTIIVASASNGHQIHPLLMMERAKMRPRDKILSLVRIYFVESELVGDPFPILSNEVVGLSCLCV